ncbi:lysine biosynthesis protein LysW [Micromonospora sp. RP3T]|uniref:lysine biosynthesis protein LysW n=1 Tax=Micromonospora sp. RP3T TaxID=2135446 RepID=UPI000D155537|nr:lysine biosynthesis protein LysW [Micromonospora sp. RP3T]PTA46533.1 lysine biosynthesis protein LysW [Micromonospora sp. RP3T]
MSTVACPDCAASVPVPGEALVSEILVCRECDSELEVVGVDPPLLARAPEVEEDWGE